MHWIFVNAVVVLAVLVAVVRSYTVDDRLSRRRLRFLANATLAYPVAFVCLWYGQWFLAWHVLGHAPIPKQDDPVYGMGYAGWTYYVTVIAVYALPLMFIASVGTNLSYIATKRPTAVQAGIRLQSLAILWIVMWRLAFTKHYYPIAEWWID